MIYFLEIMRTLALKSGKIRKGDKSILAALVEAALSVSKPTQKVHLRLFQMHRDPPSLYRAYPQEIGVAKKIAMEAYLLPATHICRVHSNTAYSLLMPTPSHPAAALSHASP